MPARVRRPDQLAEVVERPVVGVDAAVVGDVVAVVLERRREERQEPQAVDAEVLQVVELLDEPAQIADAVAVRVVERLDVRLVDDGVLVPERILAAPSLEACHRDVPDLLPRSKCAPGARKRRIPRGHLAPRALVARRSGERAAAVQVIAREYRAAPASRPARPRSAGAFAAAARASLAFGVRRGAARGRSCGCGRRRSRRRWRSRRATPWRCDFDSHGACVEFEDRSRPTSADGEPARRTRSSTRELPFWGLSNLDGWRIQYRNDAGVRLLPRRAATTGCTDYLEKTLSVRIPPDAGGCFEAAELLHELGHYELGDPMHSNSRWKRRGGDQFAPMVWDRPDAAPECVERYHGIRARRSWTGPRADRF